MFSCLLRTWENAENLSKNRPRLLVRQVCERCAGYARCEGSIEMHQMSWQSLSRYASLWQLPFCHKKEGEKEGNNMLWHVPQRFEDSSDLFLFPTEIVLWISTFNYQNPIKNGRKNDSFSATAPPGGHFNGLPQMCHKNRHIFFAFPSLILQSFP